MKTYAPSSTNRLALASAMPLDPPVMTATLPSSFPMTSPSRLRLWSFGEAPDNCEMGLPASGVESESAHIGGAKSIRVDGLRPAATIGAPVLAVGRRSSAWAMMTAALPTSRCSSMCWARALEGAPCGAGLHHDGLG